MLLRSQATVTSFRRLAARMSAGFRTCPVLDWRGPPAAKPQTHRPPRTPSDTSIAWRARRLQWANGRRKPLTRCGGIGTFGAHRFAKMPGTIGTANQAAERAQKSQKGPEIERPVVPPRGESDLNMRSAERGTRGVALRCVACVVGNRENPDHDDPQAPFPVRGNAIGPEERPKREKKKNSTKSSPPPPLHRHLSHSNIVGVPISPAY